MTLQEFGYFLKDNKKEILAILGITAASCIVNNAIGSFTKIKTTKIKADGGAFQQVPSNNFGFGFNAIEVDRAASDIFDDVQQIRSYPECTSEINATLEKIENAAVTIQDNLSNGFEFGSF